VAVASAGTYATLTPFYLLQGLTLQATHGFTSSPTVHTRRVPPCMEQSRLGVGLASISIWLRSDRRKYSAIMCDQKHEWSRSPRPSAAVQTRPTTTVLQPIPWVQPQRYCQTVDANKQLLILWYRICRAEGKEGGEGCSSKSAGVVWWDAVGGVHTAQCQTTTAAGR